MTTALPGSNLDVMTASLQCLMHKEEPWLAPGLNLSVLPAAHGTQQLWQPRELPLGHGPPVPLSKIKIPSRKARREQTDGLLLALDTPSGQTAWSVCPSISPVGA